MEKITDALERVSTKKGRKQFLEIAGPLLLCLTYIEDGLRVFLRWSEQYAHISFRMGFGSVSGVFILLCSASVQLGGSWLIVRPAVFRPSRVKPASYALLCFTVLQPFVYGQAKDVDFVCRSITLIGGFLILIYSENVKQQKMGDRGLIMDERSPGADRLQLSGRLLLTLIFFFQAIRGKEGGLHSVMTAPGFFNIVFSLVLLALAVMVCVGFKTEWSAIVLTVVLGLMNIYMYPFWMVHERMMDYYKYYFFQTLSIMGGMLLLSLHGPGGLSLDGQKKGL
jgi:uncharacterized membrane protein YphA (DoxX/SURF4 family)